MVVDVDDCLGKCLRSFLRKVVSDSARNSPVFILANKFLGIGARIRMWRAVGVTFQRNGRDCYHRGLREPPFQIVVFRLTFG